MATPSITKHAVERYQQRVAPGASALEARMALQQFVSLGKARPNPRRWMCQHRPGPQIRYVYWVQRPRVCAIVRDGAVVTVITRELIRTSTRPLSSVPRPRRTIRPTEEARWRWNRSLEQPGGEADQELAA